MISKRHLNDCINVAITSHGHPLALVGVLPVRRDSHFRLKTFVCSDI